MERYVFATAAMAADMAAYQPDKRDRSSDFTVTAFVRKRIVRNRYDGACLWSAQ